MGRDTLLSHRPARRHRGACLLLCLLPFAAPRAEAPALEPPFPLRAVRVGGALDAPAVHRHVDFVASIGFNALWVPAERAGGWFSDDGQDPPRLDAAFERLLGEARAAGLRLILSVNPVVESDGRFVFARAAHRKRLRRWLRLLERRAGIDRFVLSFHGAPLRHSELQDLLEYGRVSASAHLEVAALTRGWLRQSTEMWLEPAVANDRLLGDSRLRYPAELLAALPRLDPGVGVVWAGPQAASPRITAGQLAAIRQQLGGRPLLLQDRFPANHGGGRMATALVLAPLRAREPAIADEIAGYVACPMEQLGASRLALLTVADFLRDPDAYDADASWNAAMDRLAGDDASARRALATQALEWGGFIGERNYHTASTENHITAAESLRGPAASAMWRWPARRYDERMAALSGLSDRVFGAELLEVMARRRAIARAVPTVREIRARIASGRTDFEGLVETLRQERQRAADETSALLALDRFLRFSGVAGLVQDAASAPDPAPAPP